MGGRIGERGGYKREHFKVLYIEAEVGGRREEKGDREERWERNRGWGSRIDV